MAPRAVRIATSKLRVAPSEIPDATGNVVARTIANGRHFVEPAEADQCQCVIGRIGREFRDAAPGLDGQRTLAVHRGRENEHLQIVRRIGRRNPRPSPPSDWISRLAGWPATASPHRPTLLHVWDGMWLMWLAPGIALPRYSAHALGPLRLGRQFGGVNVEVTGARVTDVALQRSLQHAEEARHGGIREVLETRPRQKEEERFRVKRRHIEIVRMRGSHAAHGLGVGMILLGDARLGIETFDVSCTPMARINDFSTGLACDRPVTALSEWRQRRAARRARSSAR